MKEYLSFRANFHQYSISNISLIQTQFQGATAVGSFSFWKEKGFSVQKGEKGIQILVPNRTVPKFKDQEGKWKSVNKASEEEKKKVERGQTEVQPGRLYFSIGNVFDVSQTDASAKDLPSIFPNRWLEGSIEDYKLLYKGMEAIAEKNGVKIIAPKEELGAAKGVSYTLTKEVALNPRNSELQNVKTLLHELAHAKLHTKETHMNYTAPEKEFQAEMTAYTVASYFGIDTSEYSLGYLANWTQGRELKDKTKLLKEVHDTSMEFIETIESNLNKENEKSHEKEVEGLAKSVDEKNVLLVQFTGLSNTTQELVSVSELKERASRDTAFRPIENAEQLHGKEFIDAFNESNKERFAALDQNEITRPTMLIQWSENENFKSNELIPFGEANEKMTAAITKIEEAKEIAEAKGEYVSYDITRYHIVIPKDVDEDFGRMQLVSMDRLDLGDGAYTSPYQQVLNEKTFLSDEVKHALRDDVIEHTPMEPAKEKMFSMLRSDGINPPEYEYVSIRELKEREAREAGLVYEEDGSEIEPAYKTPLVTIEALPNAKDETVGIMHMMDAVSKDIHQVPVLHPDSSNRDLFVPLMRENGERGKLPLDMMLNEKLYEKVQHSILDGRGNQSFVVHQKDADMKLHEIVRTERYGALVDKEKGQENPTFSEKEVELYKKVRKKRYAPIASLNQQLQQQDKNEPSLLEKDLSAKYETYKRAQHLESANDIDSIVNRVTAEERYYATKDVSIDNELVSQKYVMKLEKKVEEKLSKEGITQTNHPTSVSQEPYKEQYKEQVLEEIAPSKEEERYKDQYKIAVLELLGIDKEKSPDKTTDKPEKSSNEEKKEPVKQEGKPSKSREDRVKEMKEFEKVHSFTEVYQLKKEALQEIKEMNLTDSQREKLSKLEKALDTEKQEYDKNNKQASNKDQGKEEGQKEQNSFSKIFNRFKGVTKKAKTEEQEMER